MEKIKEEVEHWNNRFELEVKPYFSSVEERSSLLASDVVYAISDTHQQKTKWRKGKVQTYDCFIDCLIERYPKRWLLLDKEEMLHNPLLKNVYHYYVDWEGLTEEEKTPIRDYRQSSYFKNVGKS